MGREYTGKWRDGLAAIEELRNDPDADKRIEEGLKKEKHLNGNRSVGKPWYEPTYPLPDGELPEPWGEYLPEAALSKLIAEEERVHEEAVLKPRRFRRLREVTSRGLRVVEREVNEDIRSATMVLRVGEIGLAAAILAFTIFKKR